jgi:hypothetical protein
MKKADNPLSFKNILSGIIVTVIGGIILAYIIQDARFSQQSPTPTPTPTPPPELLQFQFIGAKDQKNPVYELTEDLAYLDKISSDTNNVNSIDVKVTRVYTGTTVGTVVVGIRTSDAKFIEKGRWENFQNSEPSTITISLSPEEVLDYVKMPLKFSDAYANSTSSKFQLWIEVKHLGDEVVLAEIPVTVKHTPWMHQTWILDSSLSPNQDLVGSINITNYGFSSSFLGVANLYDLPKKFETLNGIEEIWGTFSVDKSKGWWPGYSWGEIKVSDCFPKSDTAEIETGKSHEFKFKIQADCFEPSRMYILETFAWKDLGYITFSDTTSRFDSAQSYRMRDIPTYSTISLIVLK